MGLFRVRSGGDGDDGGAVLLTMEAVDEHSVPTHIEGLEPMLAYAQELAANLGASVVQIGSRMGYDCWVEKVSAPGSAAETPPPAKVGLEELLAQARVNNAARRRRREDD